jgi:hypothetical protein
MGLLDDVAKMGRMVRTRYLQPEQEVCDAHQMAVMNARDGALHSHPSELSPAWRTLYCVERPV